MSWEVHIRNNWACADVEMLISRRTESGLIVLEADPLVFHEKHFEGNACVIENPTFRIPYAYARDLFPSLAKALNDHGVKLPEKSFVEGELAATKMHLGDMRELVFQYKGKR